jgi:DHA2 family multidrug resistance protein-like MFS transporter
VVAGCALLTAISLVLLLKLQSASAPMLPLDLLRIPLFALSIGTSFCSFAAQMAVFVMLPFMLQDYLGMSAARAGMLLTAWPVAVALTGVVAGKLGPHPAGLLGGIGLAVMCLGLLALLTVDRSTPDGVTLAMFAVCGLGRAVPVAQQPHHDQCGAA